MRNCRFEKEYVPVLFFIYKRNSKKGVCIDGDLLKTLFGEAASKAKDQGQRAACGCSKSKDIGGYKDFPCMHNCLYCYANPSK